MQGGCPFISHISNSMEMIDQHKMITLWWTSDLKVLIAWQSLRSYHRDRKWGDRWGLGETGETGWWRLGRSTGWWGMLTGTNRDYMVTACMTGGDLMGTEQGVHELQYFMGGCKLLATSVNDRTLIAMHRSDIVVSKSFCWLWVACSYFSVWWLTS